MEVVAQQSMNSRGAAASPAPTNRTTPSSSSYLPAKTTTPSSSSSVLSPTSRRMDAAEKSMSSVRSRTSIFEKAEAQKRQNATATPPPAATAAAAENSTKDPSEQSVRNKKNMFEKKKPTTAAVTTPHKSDKQDAHPPNSVKSRSSIFERAEQSRSQRSYNNNGQPSPATTKRNVVEDNMASPKPPTFPSSRQQQQQQQQSSSGGSVSELKHSFQQKVNVRSPSPEPQDSSPQSTPSPPSPPPPQSQSQSKPKKRWPTAGTPGALYGSSPRQQQQQNRPMSHRPSSITTPTTTPKEDPPGENVMSDTEEEEKKEDSPEKAVDTSLPLWKQQQQQHRNRTNSTTTSTTSPPSRSASPTISKQPSWIKHTPTDERMESMGAEVQQQQQQQQPQKQSPPTQKLTGGRKTSRSVVAAWQAKQSGLPSPDTSEDEQEEEYVPDPEDVVQEDSPTSSLGNSLADSAVRQPPQTSQRPAWMTAQKFPSRSPASDVGVDDEYQMAATTLTLSPQSTMSQEEPAAAVVDEIVEKALTPTRPAWMTAQKFPTKSPAASSVKHDAPTPVVSHQSMPPSSFTRKNTAPASAAAGRVVVEATSQPTTNVTSPASATSSPLWADLASITTDGNQSKNTHDVKVEEYEEIRNHTENSRNNNNTDQSLLSMDEDSVDKPVSAISTSLISQTDSKDMSSIGTPNTSLLQMNETSLESLYSPPVKIKTPGYSEDQEEVEMEFGTTTSSVASGPTGGGGAMVDGRPVVVQQPPQGSDDTPSKSLFQMAADSVLVVDYNQLQGMALEQTETQDTDDEDEEHDHVPTTPSQLPQEIQDIMDGKTQSKEQQQRFFNFDGQSDDEQDQRQQQEQKQKHNNDSAKKESKDPSNEDDMYNAQVSKDTSGVGVEMDAFETSSPDRISIMAGRPLPSKSRTMPRLAPSQKDTGSYSETGRPSRSSPPKKKNILDSPLSPPPPPPSELPPSDDENDNNMDLAGEMRTSFKKPMGTGTARSFPTGSFPSAPSDEGLSSPMSDAGVFGPLVGAFPSPTNGTSPTAQQQQQRAQSQPRSSRYQTPETTKGILRESKTDKGARRSVRFSDPPPPLVVDADAPPSTQSSTSDLEFGGGWEQQNDNFESVDNFYSSISPRATTPASDARPTPPTNNNGGDGSDDPAQSYYNSISPHVNTTSKKQTYDNPMDEYYGNASPTNAGGANATSSNNKGTNEEEDAANILKYWATSDDSQNFNDADQWMDQDPDLEDPVFREDSPSPEPVPIMYNSNNNNNNNNNANVNVDTGADPSFQAMSQAMASPDPIPPPPPLSPDEAMDVFNPFGTFSCGTSGGFVSSDPFSPISNSRTPSMAQQKQQQSSDPFSPISSSRTPSAAMVQQKQQQQQQQQHQKQAAPTSNNRNGTIKLAPSARDGRKPIKKLSPPSRDRGTSRRQSSSVSSNGSGSSAGRLYSNSGSQSYSRSYSGSGDWDSGSEMNEDWDSPTNNLEI